MEFIVEKGVVAQEIITRKLNIKTEWILVVSSSTNLSRI